MPASVFDECRNLEKLYEEYRERFKLFFELLVQKDDEGLKRLIFRLDFSEYYADRFYQGYEFDFSSQSEYRENVSMPPFEKSITSIEEIKDTFKSGMKEGSSFFMRSPREQSLDFEDKQPPVIPSGATRIIRSAKHTNK